MQYILPAGAALIVTAVGLTSAAYGSKDSVVVNHDTSLRVASPLEIANARPYKNPLKAPSTSNIRAEEVLNQYIAGARAAKRFHGNRAGDVTPKAFGTFGIPYTTGRVTLGPTTQTISPNYLATTYPYSSIGKLTMSAGYCSASLILRSVIVTAAHCVQEFGSGSSIFSNFQFTPAHYGPGTTAAQQAPYGSWSWRTLLAPASWADGTDIGSGPARENDLAVILLNTNAAGRFIGDLTGSLGYGWNDYSFTSSPKTGNLAVAATSTFGYPALMDSGGIQQRTDGPTYTTTIGGAAQLWQGNYFSNGASGGPWIVNFRAADPVLSGGAEPGTASKLVVVGVTSWGSPNPNAPKDNYSSRFGQNTRYPAASYGVYGAGNIGALLNTLCSATTPDGQTYAQLGYCN
jgi:Trypsin